jgi:hypothetical protein
MPSSLSRLWLVCSCLVLGACATYRTPGEVEQILSRGVSAANARHLAGMDPEASVMMHAVSAVDAEFPGLAELRDSLDPAVLGRLDRGWLGQNRRLRAGASRPVWLRALLYVPDRLLDLGDVVSFGLNWGPGAFLDYHVTRALQASVGARSVGGLGWHDQRSLGLKSQAEAGLTLIAVGAQSHAGALLGTSGAIASAGEITGLHRPSDRIYQELRDYWAIGGGGTVGLMGAEIDFHPVQLADFLAGLVTIDFLNDDFATTRGLRLNPDESLLVRQIWTVRASRKTLEGYLDAKRAMPRGSDVEPPVVGDPTPRPPEPPADVPAAPAETPE